MKLPYRQGLIRCQVDSNNTPLILTRSVDPAYVDLYVNTTPIIFAFVHGEADYICEEQNTIVHAWGPFASGTGVKYWLYIDIHIVSGVRTFNYTSIEPSINPIPPKNPVIDQHWFDTNKNIMFVFDGFVWNETIRYFTGTYSGGITVTPYHTTRTITTTTNGVETTTTSDEYFTSQVGLNTPVFAGYILYDKFERPIVCTTTNKFLTTESQFYTTKSLVSAARFDTSITYAEAIENIPSFSVVCYHLNKIIGLASYDDPFYRSAVGIIRTPVYTSEIAGVVTSGYITNVEWNFTAPPTSPIYLGALGQLQFTPPATGFIQKIATVVSSNTILLGIDPQIIYKTPDVTSDTPTVNVNVSTGKFYTVSGGGGALSGGIGPDPENSSVVLGYTYRRIHNPKMYWNIVHNLNTSDVIVQVFNDAGFLINPNFVDIVDANSIQIGFSEPMTGTAQILLFTSAHPSDLPNTNIPVHYYAQPADQPLQTWYVEHELGYKPIVRVFDLDGIVLLPASVKHVDDTTVIIKFGMPTSGTARFL